jgi:hypothetical protein
MGCYREEAISIKKFNNVSIRPLNIAYFISGVGPPFFDFPPNCIFLLLAVTQLIAQLF